MGTAISVAPRKTAAQMLADQIGVEGTRSTAADETAGASRTAYTDRLNAFDPTAYAAQAGAAAASRGAQALTEAQQQRDVLNNRRGILGSPTGSATIQRAVGTELGRTLGDHAFQAAGMELQATGQQGALYNSDRNAADQSRGRQLDLMTGQRDYETAQANAEAERQAAAKKSKYGVLGKIVGGAAGTLLGPLGSKLGAKLGEWGASKLG